MKCKKADLHYLFLRRPCIIWTETVKGTDMWTSVTLPIQIKLLITAQKPYTQHTKNLLLFDDPLQLGQELLQWTQNSCIV